MSELGKLLVKNGKFRKKMKINVEMPQCEENTTSEKEKIGSNQKLGLE